MYFFIDSADRSVTAFHKIGIAAHAALEKLNKECPTGGDPVQFANTALVGRGVLVNLSGAFEAIADSDDIAAQELALQCKEAIDSLYGN